METMDIDSSKIRVLYKEKAYVFETPPDTTIEMLQALIFSQTEVQPECQQLYTGYPRKLIPDDDQLTVSDVGIVGATLHLTESMDLPETDDEPRPPVVLDEKDQKDEKIDLDDDWMELEEFASLKRILFGGHAVNEDIKRWHQQGFLFASDKSLTHYPWGLEQNYGGPCGVLSPIQAFLLHHLIYKMKVGLEKEEGRPLSVTPAQCQEALNEVLADILIKSTEGAPPFVWVSAINEKSIKTSRVATRKELIAAIVSSLNLLRSDVGVICFVYSVLLSKTLKKIKEDGDLSLDAGGLVQRFGHCTQELVNLMICGVASSNVFDGEKNLGQTTLKGIPKAQSIGYLTILESLRYLQVGDFYKCPEFPIWVVGSSSHYTVLFGLDESIGKLSPSEMYLKRLRQAFSSFDPENQGFIQKANTANVLALMDIQAQANEINFIANADEMGGIVLWQNFLEAVTGIVNPPALRLVGGGGPSKFDLYHYNGIKVGNRNLSNLSKMYVEPDGPFVRPQSHKQNLAEVIATKWKSAIIDLKTKDEPKII